MKPSSAKPTVANATDAYPGALANTCMTLYELTPIIILVVLIVFFYFIFTFKSKKDKEYESYLEKRLEDEFIIDPETGAKLTLEQAESGHWVAHDNEFLPTKAEDINKLFSPEEKNAELALNYLKESREYLKQTLNKSQVQFLENTKILSKYADWSYSHVFKLEYCNGYVFHPAVLIPGHQHTYFDDDYHESQIMFWIKLHNDYGHYYLREKSDSEKFFDLIRNDDDLQLEGYESFTFKKTVNRLLLNQLIENFKEYKGLEIELLDDNLLIKNQKYINMEDLKLMEEVVRSVC